MVESEVSKYDRTIDKFGLIKKLGEGKFGIAWSAIQTTTGRSVCVKILKNIGNAEDV